MINGKLHGLSAGYVEDLIRELNVGVKKVTRKNYEPSEMDHEK